MKETIFKDCAFVILPDLRNGYIIDYPDEMEDHDILNGNHIEDNFTNQDDLPKEKGVYKCDIHYSYNTPCYYPDEGDFDLEAKNIVKVY